MSYRVILLPLFGQEADARAIEAALAVANRFEATVDALFCRIDPNDIVPFVGEGVSPAVIQQMSDAAREEMERQRDLARRMLEGACQAAGYAVGEERGAGGRTVRWVEATGDRSEIVMHAARLADLVVFARPDHQDESERHVVEATLLGGGRPLLIVPPVWSGSIGHTVAVAWNGGLEAARAVAAAMPFLEASSTAYILTAETAKTRFEQSADLAAYLAQHGVPSERHALRSLDGPVGAALLTRASEAGADLLVLGGYSRSRFREMVLGGVTRHVLGEATLPVLMAH